MKKSTFITRIVCLSIAFVLLIVTFAVSSGGKTVMAGAGSGRDEKITTVNEMSDMIDTFSDMFGGYDFASAGGMDTVKYSLTAGNFNSKYDSVTMHETSSVYVNSSQRYDSVSATVTANYQRDITYYITDYAAYYVVDCIMTASAFVSGSGSTQRNSMSASMNIELYLDKNTVLIKFNRFSMASLGENYTGFEKILGKWFEFGANDGTAVLQLYSMINESNVGFLRLLDDYISAYKETGFSKSGNIYTLTDDAFKGFVRKALTLYGISVSTDDEGLKLSGSLVVDLSNNSTPKIKFDLTERFGNTSSSSASAYQNDLFEFKNINNTVIRLPDNLVTYSVEELESLLEG